MTERDDTDLATVIGTLAVAALIFYILWVFSKRFQELPSGAPPWILSPLFLSGPVEGAYMGGEYRQNSSMDKDSSASSLFKEYFLTMFCFSNR